MNKETETVSRADIYKDVEKVKEALSQTASDVKEKVEEILQNSFQDVKEKSVDFQEKLVEYVKDKPLQSIGIALLTGLIIAKLMQ